MVLDKLFHVGNPGGSGVEMPCHWNKESKGGVPAVAQWVKNLTAVAQVAMKVWV